MDRFPTTKAFLLAVGSCLVFGGMFALLDYDTVKQDTVTVCSVERVATSGDEYLVHTDKGDYDAKGALGELQAGTTYDITEKGFRNPAMTPDILTAKKVTKQHPEHCR